MTVLVRQALRFAAVGLVNTVIGLAAIYALMFFFGVRPGLANAIGYAIGLSFSFALNLVWTFSSNRPVALVLPKYLLIVVISYLLNLGAVLAAVSILSANPYLAQLLGISIYAVCMFIGCRWFVFALTPFERTLPR